MSVVTFGLRVMHWSVATAVIYKIYFAVASTVFVVAISSVAFAATSTTAVTFI